MKRKLLYIIFVLFFCVTKAQTTYVVSIGIADYESINDLRNTENDVIYFNQVMKRHSAQVYTLLGRNASHAKVISTLNIVFSRAKSTDAVILYFSGHGYPGGFCCYDMSEYSMDGGLSYQELQKIFKSCKAGRKMVFADACFSGGMRTRNTNNPQTQSARKGDVMFFLSSRTNETSLETNPYGLYTDYLVRGLKGEADANKDKYITAKELYNFVHTRVVKASQSKQHPVMWGKFNNTMVILNWNK